MVKFRPPSFTVEALEPVVSKESLFSHVNVLHKGYVDRLNKKFGPTGLLEIPPSQGLSEVYGLVKDRNEAQFYVDNMGGAFAHTLFWHILDPKKPNQGSQYLQNLKSIIIEASEGFVGSGWVWGYINRNGDIEVSTLRNHNTPFMRRQSPVFCVDLWEHAYYYDMLAARKDWLSGICDYINLNAIDRIVSQLQENPLIHPIDTLMKA